MRPAILTPMPRKKREPETETTEEKPGRKTATVHIDVELRDWITLICEHKKISASELLSPYLRPWLLPQYKEAADAIARRARDLTE